MHLAEFKDDTRLNTVATYKEWLKREGLLQDICNLILFYLGISGSTNIYISNSIVTMYFHFFVCADAYLDDETTEEDGSGDNSATPMQFPAHARRPKASHKGMQWFRVFIH
jgi:hypothetical protein